MWVSFGGKTNSWHFSPFFSKFNKTVTPRVKRRKEKQNSPPLAGKSQTDFHRAIKYKQTMQIIPIHKQPPACYIFILFYVFEYIVPLMLEKAFMFSVRQNSSTTLVA